MPQTLSALAVAALFAPGLAAAQPVTAALDYGPHAVGFRTVREHDRSRVIQPRASFDGTPIPGDASMPIDIAIWYPANGAGSGSRMSAEAYKTVWGAQPRSAVAADVSRMLQFGKLAANEAQVIEALTRPTRAVRDAPQTAGTWPLVLAGAPTGASWIGFEYLASHGYVVVSTWSSNRTATLQATRPAVALETQTRNLEYLLAFAARERLDDSRLAIVGINFDGMAALAFQMRNMRADAVVSIDGWEAKAGSAQTLRQSPYFEPLRMRVPYLVFTQDDAGQPDAIERDRAALWGTLEYATRYFYILAGFDHTHLISDVANVAVLTPDQQAGQAFVHRTVRRFLDGYVKKDAASRAVLERSPAEGLAEPLKKAAVHAIGYPPAPTSEEFEQLVMDGTVERAADVYREARRHNPAVRIFDERTLNLYAFRFTQRGMANETLTLRRLAAEAFPDSSTAAYNLGTAETRAGNAAAARSAFTRALALLDDAAGLAEDQRREMRADIARQLAVIEAR